VRDFAVERQPLRVIVDSHLRTPPTAQIFKTPRVLIACVKADPGQKQALESVGAEVLELAGADGRVDLPALLAQLAQRGCNEVTVEAGAELNGALIKAGLVDEWVIYQAPVIIGDAARGVARLDLTDLGQKLRPCAVEKSAIGPDLKWTLQFTEYEQLLATTAAKE